MTLKSHTTSRSAILNKIGVITHIGHVTDIRDKFGYRSYNDLPPRSQTIKEDSVVNVKDSRQDSRRLLGEMCT